MAQCNDCLQSPGLNGDQLCPTCKGSGTVKDIAKAVPTAPKTKKGKK